ncbi:permease [Caproicibacterium amylolyticum]|uniref:Permease n=1 Tax=Caproicibacterium amylolyticum TaxID=2766537 RepID=A0A7G9WDQ2_9FIRM|nr:permease [Caproicibacterium amylolyticum]QNO16814.1 permease [Caproicibacterium amylolyticum]
MNEISVYVVTGFLGSGKTTFCNHLLNLPDWKKVNLLFLQFESGEEEFSCVHANCRVKCFPKRMLEQQLEEVIRQVAQAIETHPVDEIWVEWNGTAELSQLKALLFQPQIQKKLSLQKIIFLADADSIETTLGRTGQALLKQLAESDLAVMNREKNSAQYRRVRRQLCNVNPWIPVSRIKSYDAFYEEWFEKESKPINLTLAFVLAAIILYFAARPVCIKYQIPFDTVINSFLGIVLQAIPFLLVGVLFSSAVQVFLPQNVVERWFSKSTGTGMLLALAAGFCFPVCDCASVPFFKGLLLKGVPLPAAVTFLLAAPIVNPVVLISTYYAFGGSWQMVLSRLCCGIIIALLVGLSFALHPLKNTALCSGAVQMQFCRSPFSTARQGNEALQKIDLFFQHARSEFFSVGKYLLVGALFSSVFQAAFGGTFTAGRSGNGLAVSILLLMLVAFGLSLCSTSDAVIARSFSTLFPNSAVLAFLVFGPMIDVKNLLMLSSSCSKRFIIRLAVSAAVLCFGMTLLLGCLKGGV